jgi:Ca2+-binding EF-hand superfamily protein
MPIKSSLLLAATLLTAVCVSQAREARPAEADASTTRRAGGEHERGAPRFNPLIAALDTNGDGVIDDKELANAAESLKKLDKNHDGKLTPDEVQPAPRGERRASAQPNAAADAMVARLMQFDKNGDGKLAKDELPERMQALFEKGDPDKDGFLSKEEISKLAASQAAASAAPPRRTGGRSSENEDDDD